MKKLPQLMVVAAGAHLLLAGTGACGLHFRRGGLGRALTYYATLSGADRQWGFFSNDARTETRIRFAIEDAKGNRTIHRLDEGANREEALRFDDVMARLWAIHTAADDKMNRTMMASLAGKMFAHYPDARSVTLLYEAYPLPGMNESLHGARPAWVTVDEVKYVRQNSSNRG